MSKCKLVLHCHTCACVRFFEYQKRICSRNQCRTTSRGNFLQISSNIPTFVYVRSIHKQFLVVYGACIFSVAKRGGTMNLIVIPLNPIKQYIIRKFSIRRKYIYKIKQSWSLFVKRMVTFLGPL